MHAAASQQITDEVTSWPGVTAGPGRRGEFAFRVGQPRDRPPARRPRRALLLPQGRLGRRSSRRARWIPPGVPDKPGPAARRIEDADRRARRDRADAPELPARRHAPRRARRGLSGLRPRATSCLAARLRASRRSSARRKSSPGSAVSSAPRPRRRSRCTDGTPSGWGRRRSPRRGPRRCAPRRRRRRRGPRARTRRRRCAPGSRRRGPRARTPRRRHAGRRRRSDGRARR